MKLFILIIASLFLYTPNLYAKESCDIEKIIGAKVEPGMYKVNVRREDSNFYQITGQDIYIKTRMCLELAIGDDAILEIQSVHGSYIVGQIHFLN